MVLGQRGVGRRGLKEVHWMCAAEFHLRPLIVESIYLIKDARCIFISFNLHITPVMCVLLLSSMYSGPGALREA